MNLITELYESQLTRWPQSGRVILAQFDTDSIVVYQAFRPEIGRFAAERGYFGGEFKFDRMSWIKPNFLLMMYRSGWGTKPGQEVTLAIRLRRSAFDEILGAAVHSTFATHAYKTEAAWRQQLRSSTVRLQWDPDHDPHGHPVERRAIQLGLRGATLAKYAREWILEVDDVSRFVAEQRSVLDGGDVRGLLTPRECVYTVPDPAVSNRIGIR